MLLSFLIRCKKSLSEDWSRCKNLLFIDAIGSLELNRYPISTVSRSSNCNPWNIGGLLLISCLSTSL
uniref:Uncharacterized protein n=1 Tax=Caenorhabditis japonica TaxID=281687 RepID=A0A8R1EMT8_CAEJA